MRMSPGTFWKMIESKQILQVLLSLAASQRTSKCSHLWMQTSLEQCPQHLSFSLPLPCPTSFLPLSLLSLHTLPTTAWLVYFPCEFPARSISESELGFWQLSCWFHLPENQQRLPFVAMTDTPSGDVKKRGFDPWVRKIPWRRAQLKWLSSHAHTSLILVFFYFYISLFISAKSHGKGGAGTWVSVLPLPFFPELCSVCSF